MKYIVILGDGMADNPRAELDNKTPLQYANKPNMNYLASCGKMGMVKTVPAGYPPGSDVANLSVLGYAPEKYYTGRSPLEAVSMGVELAEQDVAFRCNLVTLAGDGAYAQKEMADYSAGEITSEEAAELIKAVDSALGGAERKFYPGISYRHLMTWQGGPEKIELTPPHDISGRIIGKYLPAGDGQDIVLDIMRASYGILKDHPVNICRVQRGLRPANSVWLWGQGKKPALPLFKDLYGLNGAVISAVDLIMGIGICAGLKVIKVPGATGNIHTNFLGKAEAALSALLNETDFVYLHIEAPDEAGHQGDSATKVKAIEEIDRQVLEPLIKGLSNIGDYRIMLLPDHPTPISIKTHTDDPVPFVIMDSREQEKSANMYDEFTASTTGLTFDNGPDLMKYFLGQ